MIGGGLSNCDEAGMYGRNDEFRKQLEAFTALHPLVAIRGHITWSSKDPGDEKQSQARTSGSFTSKEADREDSGLN